MIHKMFFFWVTNKFKISSDVIKLVLIKCDYKTQNYLNNCLHIINISVEYSNENNLQYIWLKKYIFNKNKNNMYNVPQLTCSIYYILEIN